MSETNKNEATLDQSDMDNAIKVVRDMESAGMPREQAECMVSSMKAMIGSSYEPTTRRVVGEELDKRDLVDKAAVESISRRVVGEELDKRDLVDEAELDKRDYVDKATLRSTIGEELDKRDLVDKAAVESISRRVVGEELDKRKLVSEETLSNQMANQQVAFEKSLRIAMMQTVAMMAALLAIMRFLS